MSGPTRQTLTAQNPEIILSLNGVKKHFPIKEGLLKRETGRVKAVDGVDLDVRRGETHAIVGESGCGKSTLLESILHLEEPTGGEVKFQGSPVNTLSGEQKRQFQQEVQIVFQDPDGSLNPRMTVLSSLIEPMKLHSDATDQQIKSRALELLHEVGLGTEHASRYPHELSGGQKQRVAIARAIALNPSVVLLDEPTSALDVSVQSQMLKLLDDLKESYNLTYVLVTHNLAVVRQFADRISVMYLGNIVERAPTEIVFENPVHPYTQALLSAVPIADPDHRPDEGIVLPGDVPDPSDPPTGCRLHPRCPIAVEECKEELPQLETKSNDISKARCIRANENVELE
jgi:oligopeptide/dipeptide ABC transporter ATP-binding protein